MKNGVREEISPFIKEGALEVLCDSLKSADPELIMSAVSSLKYLMKEYEVDDEMDLLISDFDIAGGIENMLELTSHKNEKISSAASEFMQKYCYVPNEFDQV